MRNAECWMLRACTLALLVVVAMLGGSVAPAGAQALAEPATVADDLTHTPTDSEIHAWLEKGGLPNGRAPVAPSEAVADGVDALWKAEHAPTPVQAAGDALHGELNALRTTSKLLPKLGGAAGILSHISLGATAFFAGYEIGSAVRSLFINTPQMPTASTVSGPSNPSITGAWYFDQGDQVTPLSQGYVRYAPYNGFAGTYDGYHIGYTTYSPGLWAFPSQDRPGWETQIFHSPSDGLYYFRAGQPIVDDHLTSGATQIGSRVNWPAGTQGTNGEPAATTEQRVATELHDHPDRYPTVLSWLDSHMGGDSVDPTGQVIKMPACDGDSYTTCHSKLQAAGFTGTITQHTLSNDDAVLEKPADKVTATTPALGTQTAFDSEVEVYVNPATLPTMTTTETAVADTLATNNPGTVTEDNKKSIARACVKYATAVGSGRETSDCTLLPIFVTGSDAQGPAENDMAAFTRNPAWFLLNRRTAVSPTRWYRNLAEPEPGCATVDKPTYGNGDAAQCDEFPYWSTLQANGGTMQTLTPSIRWVSGRENGLQGNRLAKFYSADAANTLPAGCNIYAEDPTTTVPSMASAFLNVPLPLGTPVTTTWACNTPPTP